MSKFKIGDKVKVVKCGQGIGDKGLGRILTIAAVDGDYYGSPGVKVKEEPTEGEWNHVSWLAEKLSWIGEDSFEIITKTEAQKETNMYKLNLSSSEAIDFMEIHEDLSRENPVAIVEFKSVNGNKEYFMVFHYTLLDKSYALNIPSPDAVEMNVIEIDSPEEYQVWIDWAKKVKKAKWTGEKGTVTISKVSI